MTEDEAKDWIRERFGASALERLSDFASMLLKEAERQSLIARSTFAHVWSRHIADSAQLVGLAPEEGTWVDVGSGGGLPGIVVAMLRSASIVLIEPRRKRADFLEHVVGTQQLTNCTIWRGTVQNGSFGAGVLSARAVANPDQLLSWSNSIVSRETIVLLPRGASAIADIDMLARSWHGAFHVEQSLTDPASGIIVAQNVSRR